MIGNRLLKALGVTGLATATAITVAIPAQAASNDPVPMRQGAHWIAGQVGSGVVQTSGYADYGLSIDMAFGLEAAGAQAAKVATIRDAIERHVNDYTTGGSSDPGSVYAGPTAKALVFAQSTRTDPATFGGVDLVSRLKKTVSTQAPTVGRIHDISKYGDYANVLGQALAARGLSNAGASDAADVTAFLLQQQCAAGFFRLEFTTSTSGPSQSCDADNGVADTDATAYAAIQLEAIDSPSTAVTAAIASAKKWLLGHQLSSGAWGGGGPTAAANANSTGLAGWALGETAASRRGAIWLRLRQVRDARPCTTKLTPDQGAVAYDGAAFSAGRNDGITSDTRGQWRRASAQAVPALRYTPRVASPLRVTGPHVRYLRAGTHVTLHVSGVTPYAKACTSQGHQDHHRSAHAVGGSGTFQRSVALPHRTGPQWWRVRDSDGRYASVTLHVLGAKRLRPHLSRHTVRPHHTVRVNLGGLAPYERVVVRWRGHVVAFGHAGSGGHFHARFHVGHAGHGRVLVTGQFPGIRRGHTELRVAR